MSDASVLLPGEGEVITTAGTTITFKVRSEATAGRFSVTEYVLPPQFAGPPPHIHRIFEHVFYVLAGQVQIQLGETIVRGGAGTSVFIPVGTPHTFSNPDAASARLLAIDTPGGLEAYYEELAAAFPPGTPLNRQVVAEIQQRYDTYPAEVRE
jgi:mannose-6-phosphate isomerase-like protein (cupin superfamily)